MRARPASGNRELRWAGVSITSAIVACGVLLTAACGSPAGPQAPLADDSDAAVTEAVDSITTFPTQLDPRIWNGKAMKPDVRDAILRVVNRVTRDAQIEGLTVDAVDLFGSNASYEYDDKSDVGVHVFVHKPGMTDDDLAPYMHLLNDQVERRQEGRILLYGLPLEVSFHAGRSANYLPKAGIGQYSVTDGRWVVEPVQQPDNFDRDRLKDDTKKFIGKYNDLVRAYLAGNQGFEQGLGSRSTQNLTYRALRRLNVEIPEMVDTLEDECIFLTESVG